MQSKSDEDAIDLLMKFSNLTSIDREKFIIHLNRFMYSSAGQQKEMVRKWRANTASVALL